MMIANSTPDSSDTRQASSEPAWAELVDKIKQNDAAGLEELYRVFSRGVRFYFCRQLGPQDVDDRVHDAFITVAQAIQRGDVREPDRLMGYVRTIVSRRIAAQTDLGLEFFRAPACLVHGDVTEPAELDLDLFAHDI